MRTVFQVTLAGFMLVNCYVAGRIAYDAGAVEIDRETVHTPRIERSCTIGIIADTQVDDHTGIEHLTDYLNTIAGAQPDILLFAGDLATVYYGERIPAASQVLARYVPRYGAYAVLGDHDKLTGYDAPIEGLKSAGITLGRNALVQVPTSGRDTVNIFLLENFKGIELDPSTLDSLLALPKSHGPSIFLVHTADTWIRDAAVLHGVDLLASGHTHGGQISLDAFGYSLTSLVVGIDHLRGYRRNGETLFYTCTGLGMSVLPLRYNATPSVGVLRLLAE